MSAIKTSGQLRKFLAVSLQQVADGTMEADKARNITKMAAQINESFYSEIKVAKIQHDLGQVAAPFGDLPLGKNDD